MFASWSQYRTRNVILWNVEIANRTLRFPVLTLVFIIEWVSSRGHRPRVRDKIIASLKHCSFITYALNHYQTKVSN